MHRCPICGANCDCDEVEDEWGGSGVCDHDCAEDDYPEDEEED